MDNQFKGVLFKLMKKLKDCAWMPGKNQKKLRRFFDDTAVNHHLLHQYRVGGHGDTTQAVELLPRLSRECFV